MSGTELADALRVRYPAIKVVFMSGYAERERAPRTPARRTVQPRGEGWPVLTKPDQL